MLEISLKIAMVFLIISFLLALIRLLSGPSLQDRVVALDLIASVAGGIILIYIFMSQESRYLDIVLILSLIIFLGTVAIAKYLNKEEK
jgi:multisubunit Na+/H+ antiporter MnhF subunit